MAKRVYSEEQLEMRRAYHKAYRAANKDKINAAARAARANLCAEEREHAKARRKSVYEQWYSANTELAIAREKAKYAARAETSKARTSIYSKNNRAACTASNIAWKRKNQDRVAVYEARCSIRQVTGLPADQIPADLLEAVAATILIRKTVRKMT